MAIYNLHFIKARRSYSVKDMASLWGIDRKTCSRWITDGLVVIEPGTKPILVRGSDLKQFLQNQRAIKKFPLEEDESFCFKCHKPVKAKSGSESFEKTGKRLGKSGPEQMRKIGLCEICGTKVTRYLALSQKD